MNALFLSQTALISNFPSVISNISFREIVDILLVSIAIYIVLLFVKQTKSYFVVIVSLFLIIINLVSQDLNLTLTRSILQPISTLTFIIIAIVFQREIRRFFKWIIVGKHHIFTKMKQISKNTSAEIVEALNFMAQKRIGAILVFSGKQDIDDITEGGQYLGGRVSKELLLSIFDSSSPGHDGAVIIENDDIRQFGVHLPLARNFNNYRTAGTRHRAATGITEDTDSISLIVSEERGEISIAKEGKLRVLKNDDELREILQELTGENETKSGNFWTYFFLNNFKSKILAFVVAFSLWIIIVAQTGIIKQEYEVPLSFQLLPTQYEIDNSIVTKNINITLKGKSPDINSLDTTKLSVKIDAKNLDPGEHEVTITPQMISIPSFLSIEKIEPSKIKVVITDATEEVEVVEEETETTQ
jgi:diadenylate cyclase